MKLGTDTGSLVNHIATGGTVNAHPLCGDAATVYGWTDRYACTVTEVVIQKSGTVEVIVQQDHAKRIDTNGMSECQSYEYSRNEEGRVWTFKLHKGRWKETYISQETGRVRMFSRGVGLKIGVREHYHDFSF